jgi:hypothetical protein
LIACITGWPSSEDRAAARFSYRFGTPARRCDHIEICPGSIRSGLPYQLRMRALRVDAKQVGKLLEFSVCKLLGNFEDVMLLAFGGHVFERLLVTVQLFRVKESNDVAVIVVADCEFHVDLSCSSLLQVFDI